jgi:hypothetical protein
MQIRACGILVFKLHFSYTWNLGFVSKHVQLNMSRSCTCSAFTVNFVSQFFFSDLYTRTFRQNCSIVTWFRGQIKWENTTLVSPFYVRNIWHVITHLRQKGKSYKIRTICAVPHSFSFLPKILGKLVGCIRSRNWHSPPTRAPSCVLWGVNI